MKSTSRSALLAASLIGLVGGIAGGGMTQSTLEQQDKVGATANVGAQTRGTQPVNNLSRLGEQFSMARALFEISGRGANRRRWPGLGCSVRQGQRTARKRRNQIRNRKAHRS